MKKENIVGIGGLIAAAVGSVCCIGPAILAGLGFGAGALSIVREFGVIHMPMVILAVLLLGMAFFLHYRKKEKPESNSECRENVPNKLRRNPIILWTAAVFTVFVILFPYII